MNPSHHTDGPIDSPDSLASRVTSTNKLYSPHIDTTMKSCNHDPNDRDRNAMRIRIGIHAFVLGERTAEEKAKPIVDMRYQAPNASGPVSMEYLGFYNGPGEESFVPANNGTKGARMGMEVHLHLQWFSDRRVRPSTDPGGQGNGSRPENDPLSQKLSPVPADLRVLEQIAKAKPAVTRMNISARDAQNEGGNYPATHDTASAVQSKG